LNIFDNMLKRSWIDLVYCMSFFPSNSSNICKISCILGLFSGSSYKKTNVMKIRCLLLNQYTLHTMTKCSNKWDHVFMFQYTMTRFEHIFQKQMLKSTYIFIQQHHFISIENRIFVNYIHQT
jgi:hypothetical protein